MIAIQSHKCFSACLLIAITFMVFLLVNNRQLVLVRLSSTSHSKQFSSMRSYDTITTIVTAYFPLRKSKHPETDYLLWLENLLGYCKTPMIIFTSIEYQPILYRLRQNGSLPSYFIVNYSTPLQMPPIQPLLSTFQQQHQIDPERGYHSIELYAVWCAKSFMINRSAELNPFGTKYFLYVDAGAFRTHNYRFQWWPNNQIMESIFTNDRLLLGMIAPLPRRFCPLKYRVTDGPITMDLIEGGVIGGSPCAIHWWTSVYYETINTYRLNNFFIGKDQYIMNAIALAHADRLNMMLSFRVSCGAAWFAFGPVLANKHEKQTLSYSLSCQQQNVSAVIISFETICDDMRHLT
jgi:hypothetical protein